MCVYIRSHRLRCRDREASTMNQTKCFASHQSFQEHKMTDFLGYFMTLFQLNRSQEERPIFWEVIVLAIQRKKFIWTCVPFRRFPILARSILNLARSIFLSSRRNAHCVKHANRCKASVACCDCCIRMRKRVKGRISTSSWAGLNLETRVPYYVCTWIRLTLPLEGGYEFISRLLLMFRTAWKYKQRNLVPDILMKQIML
jgi:hypothetical protein